MNTSKPISTISYNTPKYLEQRLNELVNQHIVAYWMYIKHDGEEDEKDHIHLYIEPNKRVDTMTLQEFLSEYDPKHPDKPLGCIVFKPSKVDDWILYCSHNDAYLASKLESREFAYRKEDFHASDADTFDEAWKHAYNASEWAHRLRVFEYLDQGTISERGAITSGILPLSNATQLIALRKLDRGGRSGHD